jgi:elongation factor G
MKEAFKKAKPILLEPIMAVEVSTPEDYQGDVMGDLNRRRGQITSIDTKGKLAVVRCAVPLQAMFGYSTAVRTLSSGCASYSMTPSHFEQVPNNIVEEIVNERGGTSRF